MKIKSLQLHGFKSFAERTTLIFDRQVIGIVGPNGCGKSNIVDAIRWVMGEQSAKGLRGTEMADVIFNGTATRKRASFSEVSLTFDNFDHLAPAPYSECAEVMITRRLYRSGESEYLINKVPARLKDITDLFLGTGSSARAYSIVAQGKVDQVVLAKPEDRRLLLEEAAGIAKYKVRKISAERKMEVTRQNLERVDDLVRELERNARHLDRQVERAETYRNLQSELRRLDEQVIGFKVTQLDRDALSNQNSREKLGADFEKTAADLAKTEAEIEKLRLESLNQEKTSTTDYEHLISLKEKFSSVDKDIELKTQRITLLRNQINERTKDLERIQSKSVANVESTKQLFVEKELLVQKRDEKKKDLDSAKDNLSQIETEISVGETRLAEISKELEEIRREEAKEDQKREMLQAERVALELRRAEVEEGLESFKREDLHLSDDQASSLAEVASIREKIEDLKSQIQYGESASLQSEVEISQVNDRKDKHKERLHYCEAEIKSLITLEEHEVGYTPGALHRKKTLGTPMILDLIQFKPEFQKVGEAFLTEFGQYFLSDEVNSGTSLFSSSGSDDPRWSKLVQHIPSDVSSSPLPARSLLEAVDGTAPEYLKPILESIEVVDDLSLASEVFHLQIDMKGQLRFPLSAFGWAQSQGVVARKETPFGRKRELEKLETERVLIQSELTQFEARTSELQSALARYQADTESYLEELKLFDHRVVEEQLKQAKFDAQRESLKSQTRVSQEEMFELDERLSDLEEKLLLSSPENRLYSLEEEHSLTKTRLEDFKKQKTELDQKWIEQRIEFGALEERLERIQQQTVHSEITQSEYSHNLSLYQSDMASWANEVEREQSQIVLLREESKHSESEIEELEKKLSLNKEHLRIIRTQLEDLELGRKEVQYAKDKSQSHLQELELEHQRLKHEVEELSNIVQERYHLSLQELLQHFTEQDRERLEDQTVLGALVVESQELRARLEKFGEVNLLALSEYEDIKKRLDFMNQQREDLLKTLDALQSIILRINEITEFRFRETFKAINHNFQILFPKLFGGGRAYMTLTDDKNLLETGVEIFAEPPGKKIQTMSLLSGGEKAMTSISLLFALFAYRPASFCILDEVDAPLDEVNTARYNSIIQEMATLSQFIVITHNKRTMEVAETLFGVTMQEPGVSQLVTVQLNEAAAYATAG